MAAPARGAKHLHHPTLRAVRYEYVSFQANDDPRSSLHSTRGAEEAGPARLRVA